MDYNTFIKDINSSQIVLFRFSLDGYNHYSDCRISRIQDRIYNGKIIERIEVILTKDESEKVSFLRKFDEAYKLFKLGKKGTFTLKQLWNRIVIKDIEFAKVENNITTG